MNKKNKKQQREEAIKAEVRRRELLRAAKSPIDREQMLSLVEYVGKSIIENNHDNDYKFTDLWASMHSIDAEALHSFLKSEKINDDWDVAVSCDPFDLFGPSASRLAWMPLENNELEALLEWLERTLPERGCNHDYALTREWLSSKPVDTSITLMALMAKGGGCDCEVVYNVEPEYIYP